LISFHSYRKKARPTPTHRILTARKAFVCRFSSIHFKILSSLFWFLCCEIGRGGERCVRFGSVIGWFFAIEHCDFTQPATEQKRDRSHSTGA